MKMFLFSSVPRVNNTRVTCVVKENLAFYQSNLYSFVASKENEFFISPINFSLHVSSSEQSQILYIERVPDTLLRAFTSCICCNA